jgi:hypothetical protein
MNIFASVQTIHHPLLVAVQQLQTANEQLVDCIEELECGYQTSVQPLQMKLTGILNPAVQGGLDNYRVYFSDEYRKAIADDFMKQRWLQQLGESIAQQVMIEWSWLS